MTMAEEDLLSFFLLDGKEILLIGKLIHPIMRCGFYLKWMECLLELLMFMLPLMPWNIALFGISVLYLCHRLFG